MYNHRHLQSGGFLCVFGCKMHFPCGKFAKHLHIDSFFFIFATKRKTRIMNQVDFLGDNAYVPKSTKTDTPRGIRNCNPLNIRYNSRNNWEGKYPREANNDPQFEQFQFMWQGFLAAFKLIGNTYIYRYRLNTLSAIINRWAPASDGNDPKGYLQKVCAWTGIGGNEPLSNSDPRLKNIVMAMAVVECGHDIKYHKADLDRAFEEYKPIVPNLYAVTKKYN